MSKSLKDKTISALAWNLLDKFSQFILLFFVGIWLARILLPADYGLIGMLAIFLALAPVFLDSGFSVALIRKEKLSDAEASTVFYFNLGISLFIYASLFFCAPLIASFYNKPELVLVSRILFLILIFNSLTLVQTVIFTKQINFKTLSIINFSSALISSSFALYFAYNGYGYWSLVAQTILSSLLRMILMWGFSKWRPKFIFSFQSLKELFSFSSQLLFANIIYSVFQNIYSVIIGRNYTAAQLGYYTQAAKLSDMPTSMLYSTIQSATLPVFASIQNEKERLLNAYRKTIRFASFVAFPALIGLALVSAPMVSVLLGGKWIQVVPILQMLSLAGLFTVFVSINQNFINIHGRSDIILKLELTKVVLIVIALIYTIGKGILLMVAGLVIVKFLSFLLYILVIGNIIGYRFFSQLRDMLPYFAITSAIVVVLYFFGLQIKSEILRISIQVLFAAISYLAINKMLGSKILKDAFEVFITNKYVRKFL